MNRTEKELLNRSAAETALPAHLMTLMHDEAHRQGFQFRDDISMRLNNGVKAALTALTAVDALNTAKTVDGIATSLLRDLGETDAVPGFVYCAEFALTLVEEGYLADVNNMSVLVATLMMTEMKEYEHYFHFRYNAKTSKDKAHKLLRLAQLQGLYQLRLDQKKVLA